MSALGPRSIPAGTTHCRLSVARLNGGREGRGLEAGTATQAGEIRIGGEISQ